jgi:hypothetical protein
MLRGQRIAPGFVPGVTASPMEEDPVPLHEIAVEDMFIALGHARPADAPPPSTSGRPAASWRRRLGTWWAVRTASPG